VYRTVILRIAINLINTVKSRKILIHTGRFIMYSGITKIYYRKTVGHVFTKPVQIEGTAEFFSPPVSCFSS